MKRATSLLAPAASSAVSFSPNSRKNAAYSAPYFATFPRPQCQIGTPHKTPIATLPRQRAAANQVPPSPPRRRRSPLREP
eukprot:scaffold2908_cov257-Pinguiococcus_pyrenoidosus.AAC.14